MTERCAVGRFEWERVIRRERVGTSVKLVALTLATYSDPDGTRLFPGVDRLALVTGMSTKLVKRALAELRRLDLIAPVIPGHDLADQADDLARIRYWGGRGRPTHYRLTLPDPFPVARLHPPELAPAELPELWTKPVDSRPSRAEHGDAVTHAPPEHGDAVTHAPPEHGDAASLRPDQKNYQPQHMTRPSGVDEVVNGRPRARPRSRPPTAEAG